MNEARRQYKPEGLTHPLPGSQAPVEFADGTEKPEGLTNSIKHILWIIFDLMFSQQSD